MKTIVILTPAEVLELLYNFADHTVLDLVVKAAKTNHIHPSQIAVDPLSARWHVEGGHRTISFEIKPTK